jgi:hypothetical protein
MLWPRLPAHTSSISSGSRKVVLALREPSRSISAMNRLTKDSGDLLGAWLGHSAFGHSRL